MDTLLEDFNFNETYWNSKTTIFLEYNLVIVCQIRAKYGVV